MPSDDARIETDNDEILTPRDLRRKLNGHLERLDAGDIEKLVLMRSGKMGFVILTVDHYADLANRRS